VESESDTHVAFTAFMVVCVAIVFVLAQAIDSGPDALPDLPVNLFAGAIGLVSVSLVTYAIIRRGSGRLPRFRELGRRLGLFPGPTLAGSSELARYRGTLGARAIEATLATEGLRFAVSAPGVPALTVTRESLGSRLGKLFGAFPEIEVGEKHFDDKFHLATTEAASAASALEDRRGARAAIEEAFDRFGVRRLECGGNQVVALVPFRRLDVDDHRALFAHLARAARALERVPVNVAVLGGERAALTAGSSSPRCSYCHDTVTGSEPDIIACALCRTILHEACWAELKRCPVLGCRGREPERGRVL
jgi:hypothetical protein